MPRYEFFCQNCKKLFSKILSLVDYEEGEVICPHCGSKNIEQCSLSLTGEYGFAGLSLGGASGALP